MRVSIDDIKKDLKKRLSERRYQHCLNVMDTAVKLAELWGADKEKCRIAGLTHDCAKIKDFDMIMELCEKYNVHLSEDDLNSPKVIHALLGERLANILYGIEDREILDAIKYHTTGESDMSLVSKIIFLADYIEPGRKGNHFQEVREESYKNIDKAMQKAYDYSIKKLIKFGDVIHTSTIKGRNHIVLSLKHKEDDR